PYQYEALAAIRLLSLRRRRDGFFEGHLRNFCLGSSECPPFITLSYAWGEPIYSRSILIDGHTIPVLDSVYPILEYISESRRLRAEWIWVDSICINQDDDDEKSTQVALMGRIYSASTKTVIWLGTGSRESDLAMAFLEELSAWRHKLYRRYEEGKGREVPPKLWDSSKWRHLEGLLQAPWWKRVWTLQECVIPGQLEFACGQRHISDAGFHRGIYAIWLCDPPESLLAGSAWSAAWNRRRLMQWGLQKSMGLVSLMAYTADFEFSDPRDRIYSLLGLARESDRQMVGRPTYGTDDTVEKVYTKFVLDFIQSYQSLDIICFVQLFRRPTDCHEPNESLWPSWVPDWRVQLLPFVTPLMASQSGGPIGNFRPVHHSAMVTSPIYRASGDSRPEVEHVAHLRRLSCSGLLVGVISGSGRSDRAHTDVDSRVASAHSPHWNHSHLDIINELISCLVLDSEDRYLSRRAPIAIYKEEFLDLISVPPCEISSASKPCQLARKWYEANKSFALHNTTVGDVCERPRIGRRPTRLAPHLSDLESGFASRLLDTVTPQKMNLALMMTVDGHLGMAPATASGGDVICVLLGCSVPVVLRKHESDVYEVCGEAYVQGYMNGEVFEMGRKVQRFDLR
ncbi:heterokaryon incompatibility protein-domain-containing protein, partial [Dactylonectria macrodidyma]